MSLETLPQNMILDLIILSFLRRDITHDVRQWSSCTVGNAGMHEAFLPSNLFRLEYILKNCFKSKLK